MCFGATREPVEPLKKLEPSSKKTFCRYVNGYYEVVFQKPVLPKKTYNWGLCLKNSK
jgi:hypothetical protein